MMDGHQNIYRQRFENLTFTNNMMAASGNHFSKFKKEHKVINRKLFNFTKDELQRIKGNVEYRSPLIIERYKLILFRNMKSGSVYWRRLFTLLQERSGKGVNESFLCHFSDSYVIEKLKDPSWTIAAFVREPRERLLSSFLDTAISRATGNKGKTIYEMCPNNTFQFKKDRESFRMFLELIQTCKDPHWESQVRAPDRLYKSILIGKMSDISQFTKDLLERIGEWNAATIKLLESRYFHRESRYHATDTKRIRYIVYKDRGLQDMVFKMYDDDYRTFGFKKEYFKLSV